MGGGRGQGELSISAVDSLVSSFTGRFTGRFTGTRMDRVRYVRLGDYGGYDYGQMAMS